MSLTPAQRAAGWQILFDGTSLDAWRGYRQPGLPDGGWAIEDGAIKTSGGGGDLITKQQFGDFELVLEWKASPGGNSGIMYRVTESESASYLSGPEYQVLDDAGLGDGIPADSMQAAGAIYAIVAPPADKELRPAGSWNTARITVLNGVVTHELNGRRVARIELGGEAWRERKAASKFADVAAFGAAPIGHICLQAHGNPMWFRNVRIRSFDRPMPGEIDLLAGDRMDQWHVFPEPEDGGTGPWSLTDGILACEGRPIGYARTHADYANFVLQLEWRWPGDPGNSGVLVRRIEDDKVWPRSVEAQLQSGSAGDFWNIGEFPMQAPEERTRGRNTKHLYANERPIGAWNHYEIIVDGDRVELWVNGERLNHATEVLETPGSICLQSEGAPIEFRRVRLAEIRD